MNEDHTEGKCYACGLEKPVRWKNLYTIGSEGTWLCMDCEIEVVRFVRGMAMQAIMKRRDERRKGEIK